MDRSLKQYSLKENWTEDSKSVIFALKKGFSGELKKRVPTCVGHFESIAVMAQL